MKDISKYTEDYKRVIVKEDTDVDSVVLEESKYDKSIDMVTKALNDLLSSGSDAGVVPEKLGEKVGLIMNTNLKKWYDSDKIKKFVKAMLFVVK